MENIKYYVFDKASNLYSDFYDSYAEAKNDLDNDISYAWGLDSVICECNVR